VNRLSLDNRAQVRFHPRPFPASRVLAFAPTKKQERTMGKFDRRNSMKMKRRKAQAKKKAREARARAPEVKKTSAAKKPAKKAAK